MTTKLFLSAFLLVSVATLQAQRNQEPILVNNKSLANDAIRSVDAETEGGNISIEGVPDKDARVEVYVWGRGNEAAIRRDYEQEYTVNIKSDNGKLTVSAKRKRQRADDVDISVSFRLYVPVATASELNTSGGNIQCSHLSGGRQQVRTSGGNLAFDDVKGHVSGKTSGGNISISKCDETFEISTSGGNIHARESKGKLSLSTSGGNIALDDLSGAVKATTSGGNVSADRVSGSLITSSSGGNMQLRSLSGSVEASTSGGNLHVSLNKISDYVKLRNSGSGHTTLELPAGAAIDLNATGREVRLPRLSAFNGDINDHKAKGSVNGGGVPVTIDGGDSKVVVSIANAN